MTTHLAQIQRVRNDLVDSTLSPEAIRLAQEQLDAAEAASKSTNGDTSAAILGLSVMNTVTLVNHDIDAERRTVEMKKFTVDGIKTHHDACLGTLPVAVRNPAPISQWSLSELGLYFVRSRFFHTALLSVLGAVGLWLSRPARAPIAAVAPVAAVAETADVAAVAAVAAQSAVNSPSTLRLLASQIAFDLVRDLKSNGVLRVTGGGDATL